MEIKGSAVKSLTDFIKKFHPERYTEWINSLPEDSKKIFSGPVLPSNWYPLQEAIVIPTEKLGTLINQDSNKGAWECGRYSAEISLTGIYKFFIKAASPFFIIDRAGKVFTTYYQPSDMKVTSKGDDFVVLQITRFDEPSDLIEHRIAGWIEKAMEIHGVSFVTVNINKSLAKGDEVTEFYVKWGYSN
jgi:hypothetical protein